MRFNPTGVFDPTATSSLANVSPLKFSLAASCDDGVNY